MQFKVRKLSLYGPMSLCISWKLPYKLPPTNMAFSLLQKLMKMLGRSLEKIMHTFAAWFINNVQDVTHWLFDKQLKWENGPHSGWLNPKRFDQVLHKVTMQWKVGSGHWVTMHARKVSRGQLLCKVWHSQLSLRQRNTLLGTYCVEVTGERGINRSRPPDQTVSSKSTSILTRFDTHSYHCSYTTAAEKHSLVEVVEGHTVLKSREWQIGQGHQIKK